VRSMIKNRPAYRLCAVFKKLALGLLLSERISSSGALVQGAIRAYRVVGRIDQPEMGESLRKVS
jgi:hypothetical protein